MELLNNWLIESSSELETLPTLKFSPHTQNLETQNSKSASELSCTNFVY